MAQRASVGEEHVETIVGLLADGVSQAKIAATLEITTSSLSRFLQRRPDVRRRADSRRKARVRAARSRERRAQARARDLPEVTQPGGPMSPYPAGAAPPLVSADAAGRWDRALLGVESLGVPPSRAAPATFSLPPGGERARRRRQIPPILLGGPSGFEPLGGLGRSREEIEWLLERGRRVTLSDPQGGRWMHVDPASEEYRDYLEAGWR